MKFKFTGGLSFHNYFASTLTLPANKKYKKIFDYAPIFFVCEHDLNGVITRRVPIVYDYSTNRFTVLTMYAADFDVYCPDIVWDGGGLGVAGAQIHVDIKAYMQTVEYNIFQPKPTIQCIKQYKLIITPYQYLIQSVFRMELEDLIFNKLFRSYDIEDYTFTSDDVEYDSALCLYIFNLLQHFRMAHDMEHVYPESVLGRYGMLRPLNIRDMAHGVYVGEYTKFTVEE